MFNNILSTVRTSIIDDDNLEINISASGRTEHATPVIITIKYEGKITKNNAHEYDKEQHIMKWFGSKLDKSGIQFTFRIEDDE